MNNKTDISLKFTNKVEGEDLDKYVQRLEKVKNIISQMPKSLFTSKSLTNNDYSKSLNEIYKQITNNIRLMDKFRTETALTMNVDGVKVAGLNKHLSNTSKHITRINTGLSTLNIMGLIYSLRKVISFTTSLIEKSSDYLENLNLYQVAYGEAYREADKFVNKISEMYGLDESWVVKTTGLFRQLANSMGLAEETATNLSKLMVNMSLDISSLYNVDVDRASQILQSALAGQTRPIRGVTGADITQNTLQQTLNELGIDKAISQLSFAEKRLVIIISLTRQLQASINDMGKTIENPANQMRVLNQQWERLTRAVGNVFLPIVAKVLPYLNAILMVLTEIINIVARLIGTIFNFNFEDLDFLSGVSDSALDLQDGLDGASESAKKLKQGLRGFDKLNVITTPTDTSSSVGAGGIDSKILDAFNLTFDEYNKKLENVQMKATKIRDTIMEWLGFQKNINEETGDTTFTFDHITSGTVLGALGTGGIIWAGIRTIGKVFTKLTGLKFPNISNLFGSNGIIAKAFGKNGFITSFITANPKLALIIAGVVTLITVFAKLYKENEEFREQVDTFFKTIKETFTPVLKVLKTVVEVLWKVAKELYEQVLKPLGNLLVQVLKPIFEIIIKMLDTFFKKVLKPLIEALAPFIETALKTLGDVLTKVIFPILGKVIEALEWLWKNVIDPLIPVIEFSFTKVFEGLGWVLNNIVLPPFKLITDALEFVRKKIQEFADWWNKLKFGKKEVEGNFSANAGFGGGGGGGRALASGGMPPVGQIFIANERGPELVGQIGGQTFVANQNQMLDLIKGELATAKGGTTNATFIIQVGDEEVARHTINKMEEMAKANGKPFTIGG